MRRRVALALVLTTAGCGGATGIRDEGVAVDRSAVHAGATRRVSIALIRYGRIAYVDRQVAAESDPTLATTAVVRALLAGPTRTEARQRYVTALPRTTITLNGVAVAPDPSIASVALRDQAEPAAVTDAVARETRDWQLAQVVDTLTRVPGITEVMLSVNGQNVDLAVPGVDVPGPFTARALPDPPYGPPDPAPTCGHVTPATGAPLLTLEAPARGAQITSRAVVIAGSTSAVDGGLAVELLQDSAVIARDDRYAQPLVTGGPAVPCPAFAGAVALPFGVSGAVVVRLVLTPGAAGGEAHELSRTVTTRPSAAAAP